MCHSHNISLAKESHIARLHFKETEKNNCMYLDNWILVNSNCVHRNSLLSVAVSGLMVVKYFNSNNDLLKWVLTSFTRG